MRTGAGFIQLNTPKEIAYTEGCVVSARDIDAARPRTRASMVKLPFYMTLVRQGFDDACKRLGLKALVDDEEDPPELPPVKSFQGASRIGQLGTAAAPQSIKIVVKHFETESNEFELKDFDGVMTEGEVPVIVKDDDDVAKDQSLESLTVYPWTMTDEEHEAYERLFSLWKSRSASNSASGQVHRQRTDGLLPDGTSVRHHHLHAGHSHAQDANRKREREASDGGEIAAQGGAAGEYFDEVEFALRLAEEVVK